jgi:hypothetical protein
MERKFREHEREHLGRVEADTRGPPSQPQEALEKSTKVDAEYDVVTWVPKIRVNMTKRRVPDVELREHSGRVEVDAHEPPSHLQEALKEETRYSGTIQFRVEMDAREPPSQLQEAL